MYELTAFYLYKAIFMCELLVAEAIMCVGLKRRPLFALRGALCCIGAIGVAFAIPVVSYSAWYCSLVFLFMFAVTLPLIKVCFEANAVSILFRGIAAYTTQHTAYQIFDLAMGVFGIAFGNDSLSIGGAYGSDSAGEFMPLIMYRAGAQSLASSSPLRDELMTVLGYASSLVVYIATYSLSYSFVSARLKNSDKFELKNSSMFVFVVLFVLFNVVISSVVIYSGGDVGLQGSLLLSGYNIACCLLTMYLMFEVIFKKQYERGYIVANRLLRQAGEQYALAKENIEMINLKCHDLKHQIREMGGRQVGEREIKEIENMISIYDAPVHTGNEALDIILTEKSLYCNKHSIKLYCIVDGGLLSFMEDADLYSLFGNLLDNAIEAVITLPEEKRFINLSVRTVNGFTRISTSNCCLSPPQFEGGLPRTTKADKENHGYGMKSIRLVCRKYDGELDIRTEGGMFTVNIVFMK